MGAINLAQIKDGTPVLQQLKKVLEPPEQQNTFAVFCKRIRLKDLPRLTR